MRATRTFIVLAMALMSCACAREMPRYVAIDPQTGQQIGVVQSAAPAANRASPFQAMAADPTPTAGTANAYDSRGLFGGPAQSQQQMQAAYPPQVIQAPGSVAPGSGAPVMAGPAYAPMPVAAPRGQSRAPLFSRQQPQQQVYQPYPQPMAAAPQTYAPQGYPPQTYAPQVMQAGGAYQAYAAAPAAQQNAYTLDTGDKLRVVVFGQDGLSSQYTVDAGGNVTLPLIGPVPARGQSTAQLANDISARLKQGYVRDPKVTVEIEAYRPFFILGEVTLPGLYPYTPNMTAETAIAIAGGFAPRAAKNVVKVTRNIPGQQFSGDVPLNFQLRPGDTVTVKERWF